MTVQIPPLPEEVLLELPLDVLVMLTEFPMTPMEALVLNRLILTNVDFLHTFTEVSKIEAYLKETGALLDNQIEEQLMNQEGIPTSGQTMELIAAHSQRRQEVMERLLQEALPQPRPEEMD